MEKKAISSIESSLHHKISTDRKPDKEARERSSQAAAATGGTSASAWDRAQAQATKIICVGPASRGWPDWVSLLMILNHQTGTISGIAAVYQRHEFHAEQREALEQRGAHLGDDCGRSVR